MIEGIKRFKYSSVSFVREIIKNQYKMKRILLSFSILVFCLPILDAQLEGTWDWARLFDTIGGISTEGYHMDMATDDNNNFYIMGVFRDSDLKIGTETLINRGGYDIFVCSFSNTGTFRWARSIGSAGHEGIGGLVIDGTNLYVAGAYRDNEVFFSGSAFSLDNDAHYDSFIAHYSLDGTPLEAKRVFWGSQQQRLNDMTFDGFNSYLVCVGIFRTHLVHGSLPGDTIDIKGVKDHFIARFDISAGFSNLAFHDATTYLSSNTSSNVKNINNSVIGETHTGYFVSGDLFGYMKFSATDSLIASGANSDALIFKLDGNLNYQWSRRGGAGGYDHVNSATGDDDGNIYISGKYEGTVTFDSTKTLQSEPIPGFGLQDMYISKYNREGRLIWIRNFGGPDNDDAFGMAINDHFIEVAGNLSEEGNTNTGFLKLDDEGNLINEGRIYGNGEDIGKAVGFGILGHTYISGYFNSDTLYFGAVSDPDTFLVNNTGTYDGFFGKYEYPLSIVHESTVNVTCNGGSNGSVKVRGEFGIQPYAWAWEHDPSNTTNYAGNLTAGMYVVTLTDSDVPATIVKDTFYVSEPAPIIFDGTTTDLLCFEDETGSITLNPSGGTKPYTYSWSAISGGCNLVPAAKDQSNICAGTYRVILTGNKGCSRDTTFIVSQPSLLEITGFDKADVSAPAMCDGGAKVIASGGTPAYSYLWSTAETTDSIGGLCGGLYSVTVTDLNGCQDSAKVSIIDNVVVQLQIQSPITCKDSADGAVVAIAEGGKRPYTWSWDHDGGLTDSIATDLAPGWYKVTVTDDDLVSASDSVYITEPELLQALKTISNVKCFGICDGSILLNVSGGTIPYSYDWSNGDTVRNIDSLCAGTYSVDVTDANGCLAHADAILTQPLQPLNFTFRTYEPPCYGTKKGAIKVIVSGGTQPIQSLLWSNGLTPDSIYLVPAGDYWVKATDSNGCVDTGYVPLGQPTQLEVAITENKSACFGLTDGRLCAEASGGTPGYTYLWTPIDSTTACISNLNPAVYTVTAQDANNCSAKTSGTVAQSSQIVITLDSTRHILCEGETGCLFVSVTGGGPPYDYFWSPDGETTEDLCDKPAGNYQLTATDTNNCIGLSPSYEIQDQSVPIGIATQSATDISCFGLTNGSITLVASSGNGPFRYSIDNGSSWQDDPDTVFTDLGGGDYITVFEDINGCMKYGDTLSVIEPAALVIESLVPDTATGQCLGTLEVNISGGTANYTFKLTGANNNQSGQGVGPSFTFDSVCTDDLTITVTDANDCFVETSMEETFETNISEIEAMKISIYPNPSTGKFTIEIQNEKGEDLMLEIVNLSGQMVYKKLHKYNGNPLFHETIDLGVQAKGTFLIRVNGLPVKTKLMIE